MAYVCMNDYQQCLHPGRPGQRLLAGSALPLALAFALLPLVLLPLVLLALVLSNTDSYSRHTKLW